MSKSKITNKKVNKTDSKLLIRTCNYCHNEFEFQADLGTKGVNICTTPQCPAYALFQISSEMMPREKKGKK